MNPETPRITLTSLAHEAMHAAGQDVDAATALLVQQLEHDRDLYAQLVKPMLDTKCRDACRAVRMLAREYLTAPAMGDALQRGHLAAIQQDYDSLLAFPLPDGTRLGNATREQLTTAMGLYERQAKTMMTRLVWVRLIAAKLPDETKRVEDVLTDASLRTLYQQAEKKVK